MNIENLSTLKIHKLTQEQYDRSLAEGNIDPNAIYLTPESSVKGVSPHIGDNGNWWIGETDTGVAATAGAEAAEAAAERAESQALIASNSANDAASSASEASGYATSASRASSNANTAKTNAETAATNAANSASSASSSASTATTQANNAKNSASAAATSASQASTSATQADTSASEAGTAANTAKGYRDEVKNMLDNAVIDPSDAVLVTSQNLTDTQKVTARENIGAASQADLEALNNDKVDYSDLEDEDFQKSVASKVPFVKTSEQPTFAESVDDMTDISKIYVHADGFLYAYMKGIEITRLTSNDFMLGSLDTNGVIYGDGRTRICTKNALSLVANTISISYQTGYSYIIYFYNTDTPSADSLVAKTTWRATDVSDITTIPLASGSLDGATYCRISFKYTGVSDSSDLTDYFDNLVVSQPIALTRKNDTEQWTNTGHAYNEIVDLPNNKTLIANVVNAVKEELLVVKVVEQPTFVNSIDEMTDTSKVYVMPDMSMWACMAGGVASSYTFTADDFVVAAANTNGATVSGTNRIMTRNMIDLSEGTVSIYCPEPYQYITYYYTEQNYASYIGKTAFKSGNVDDVLSDTGASGTLSGAKYCRISLRDGTKTTVDLSDRMDEFVSGVIISQSRETTVGTNSWQNTGHAYNQPADYEARIVALERALEGVENGTY